VAPGFKALAPWFNDRPSMLLRSWATPKVAHFLSALKLRDVHSRASLDAVWEKDPLFLLAETSQWVHAPHRLQLKSLWPLKAGAASSQGVQSKRPSGPAGREEEGGGGAAEFVSGSESAGDSD